MLGWGSGGEGILDWMFSSRLGEPSSKLVEEGRRRKDKDEEVLKQKSQGKRTKYGGGGGGGGSAHGGGGGGGSAYGGGGGGGAGLSVQGGANVNFAGHLPAPPTSVPGVPLYVGDVYVGPKPITTQPEEGGGSLFPWLPFLGLSHDSSFSVNTGGISGGGTDSAHGGHGDYGPPEGYSHKPSQTEVMVFSYPSFVTSFGRAVSLVTKGLRRIGENLGDRLSNTFDFSGVPDILGQSVKAVLPIENVDEKFPNIIADKPSSSVTTGGSGGGSISAPSISSSTSLSHSGPLSTSSVSHSGSFSPVGIDSNLHLSSNLNSNFLQGLQQGINTGLKGINQGINTLSNIPSTIADSLSNLNYNLPPLDLGSLSHQSSFNIGGLGGGGGGGSKPNDPQANYHQPPKCC
ncbi:putative lysozyme-like protein [Portunus trituberculatus]|uniref:putative lysozyme-like protein n=1 Tax=Portunus trituberculatus TaxID=210409 RepID=UPI001E1D06B6|nr:putative lysozyme-like protein [Portunus trituberculatus]